MADPNTQIDWWIAQAWQEVQGGADHDSLVIWLHENDLTAISSYTILQAALSCSPDEAKKIVFAHPVWAGEEPAPDLGNIEYTSETLEPEPEPDPTFELDDWADEIEEDKPVYGEEGYQVDPSAGAAPIAAADPQAALPEEGTPPEAQPAFPDQTGFDDAGDPDPTLAEPAGAFEPDAGPSATGEDEPAPMVAMNARAEPGLEPGRSFEPTAEPAPESGQSFDYDPEPAPMVELDPASLLEPMQRSADALPPEPVLEPEFQAEPALDRPAMPAVAPPPISQPAPPPILKTLPSTPAARAAVFAGAFGKKTAAAQQAPAAPDVPPSSPRDGAPPTNDLGLASVAETTPAQPPPEHPQPATATAQMPPPLVYEPLPEIELPQPVLATEPLFTATPRALEPAPPLFPPTDPGATDAMDETPPEEADETASLTHELMEPTISGEEPGVRLEPTFGDNIGDLPPDMQASMEPGGIEPPDLVTTAHDDDDGGLQDAEWDRGSESPESSEESLGYDAPDGDAEDADDIDPEAGASEDAPRPTKRVLLDPTDETGRDRAPGELPVGDSPEEMAAAAKLLGISFREGDPSDAGVDPEIAKTAKELGISFREGGTADMVDEETQLAAQKLGISFREGDPSSSKDAKPLVVKYLPMLFGVIIIFFLLLLGATFAGEFLAWFKN